MNCPHCGKEIEVRGIDWGKKLKFEIEKRLVDYGHPEKMNPQKYQAYTAVRGVIKLYVAIGKGNLNLTPDQYSECVKVLDRILPPKTDK